MAGEEIFLKKRRAFLRGAGVFGIFSGVLILIHGTLRFLLSRTLRGPGTSIKMGKPVDYPPGSQIFVPEKKVFLMRDQTGFYALSAVCSHLGCTVRPGKEGHFECPCHGSVFNGAGRSLVGPAKSPLVSFMVYLGPGKRIVIDPDRKVSGDFRLSLANDEKAGGWRGSESGV